MSFGGTSPGRGRLTRVQPDRLYKRQARWAGREGLPPGGFFSPIFFAAQKKMGRRAAVRHSQPQHLPRAGRRAPAVNDGTVTRPYLSCPICARVLRTLSSQPLRSSDPLESLLPAFAVLLAVLEPDLLGREPASCSSISRRQLKESFM